MRDDCWSLWACGFVWKSFGLSSVPLRVVANGLAIVMDGSSNQTYVVTDISV